MLVQPRFALILFTFVLSLSAPSWTAAQAGALEINQTCASNTGCFPGDAPGFPVTITKRGSYILTSNLHYFGEHVDGIVIEDDNVTVDLGGFEIRCSRVSFVIGGDRPLCMSVSGNGIGIRTDLPAQRVGIEIKNGSLIGMNSGVYSGLSSRIRDLRINLIRNFGIFAGPGTLVEGNVISQARVGLNAIGAAYRNNVFFANQDDLDQPSSGINLGGNACGSQLCAP